MLEKYSAQRLDGTHCYEFFAGSQTYQKIIDDEIGSFFVTDYLVKNFERLVIKSLGLDRYPELFSTYFGKYHQLVYLAQTKDNNLTEQTQKIAEKYSFAFKLVQVGIGGLDPVINFTNTLIKPNVSRQTV